MTSAHDIAFIPNERTWWVDQHFAMLGRALAVATHFERSCEGLDAFLHRSALTASLLSSEDAVKRAVDRIWNRRLAGHIQKIASAANGDVLLFDLLDTGRVARNYLAHDSTLGFDHWNEGNRRADAELEALREQVEVSTRDVAQANYVVCQILSQATGEATLSSSLDEYTAKVVRWVTEFDEP